MIVKYYLIIAYNMTCNKFEKTGCKNEWKNGIQNITRARAMP